MPHFVATYRYAEGSADRRDVVRPAHREYLASLDALLLSGPTDGPGPDGGALLVLEADSAAVVEGLLDADPFTAAGVVAARSVVGWSVVLGRARRALDHSGG